MKITHHIRLNIKIIKIYVCIIYCKIRVHYINFSMSLYRFFWYSIFFFYKYATILKFSNFFQFYCIKLTAILLHLLRSACRCLFIINITLLVLFIKVQIHPESHFISWYCSNPSFVETITTAIFAKYAKLQLLLSIRLEKSENVEGPMVFN